MEFLLIPRLSIYLEDIEYIHSEQRPLCYHWSLLAVFINKLSNGGNTNEATEN